MKFLLDKKEIEDYKGLKSMDILNIKTKKKIGIITKLEELDNNIIDIRFRVTDPNCQYGEGKNIDIKYVDGILQGKVYTRNKRSRKKINNTTVTFRTDKKIYNDFRLTCKAIGEKPSRVFNKFMKDYIEENENYVKEYCENKED